MLKRPEFYSLKSFKPITLQILSRLIVLSAILYYQPFCIIKIFLIFVLFLSNPALQLDPLSFLDIRDGVSSNSPLLMRISVNETIYHRYIIPSQQYISIRWNGTAGAEDTVQIVYANVEKSGKFLV